MENQQEEKLVSFTKAELQSIIRTLNEAPNKYVGNVVTFIQARMVNEEKKIQESKKSESNKSNK